MSNEEDKSASKDPMSNDEDTNTEQEENDVNEFKKLYNNKRQRDWASRNKKRSREIKKTSYHKNKPEKKKLPKYMEVGLLEMKRKEEEAKGAKSKSDKFPPR